MSNPIEIITGTTKYPAPFTHRVLILCHEKKIPYILTQINTEQKPDWFIAIAPLGLVPVMRIEGEVIQDSRAIWEYLDITYQPSLLPTNAIECAKHRSWIAFGDELAQEIAQFVKQGKMLTHDLTALYKLLQILDEQIKGSYFFGEIFSMVDITLISHILWIDSLEQKALPFKILQKYTKITSWLSRMKLRPSIRETMGDNYIEEFIAVLKQYNLLNGCS